MIKQIIIGNLTKDPEMRTTKTGKPVCQFTVAANRGGRNEDGTQAVEFVSVAAFDGLSEICGKNLAKGRKVFVLGKPSVRAYMGNDNQAHASMQMIADEVTFLTSKREAEQMERESLAGGNQARGDVGGHIPDGFVEVGPEEIPF